MTPTQLDLFLDGREALLVNGLVASLLERRPEAASAALGRLQEANPAHPDIGVFESLVRCLSMEPSALPARGSTDCLIEQIAVLAPAASRLLGPGGAAFLLPWWHAMARTDMAPKPTEAAPALRHWKGSAHWHAGDERAALRLWLPLCWLEPASFARMAATLPSPLVTEAWHAFDANPDQDGDDDSPGERSRADEGSEAREVSWFPAWLALRHRWVAHLFRPEEISGDGAPVRALRLLPDLLVLEGRGYNAGLVEQRRALQAVSPAFFREYRRTIVEARSHPT
jgi:hypothetical protein